jgi:hypothetical protein
MGIPEKRLLSDFPGIRPEEVMFWLASNENKYSKTQWLKTTIALLLLLIVYLYQDFRKHTTSNFTM